MIFHLQLPDLPIKLIDRGLLLFLGFLALVKQLGSPLDQLPFPVPDHGGMNFIFCGKLGGARFVPYGRQRHFRFEFRTVLFTFLDHAKLLSGCDSELTTLSSSWGPPQPFEKS